jgi:23S rRNA pseudouridine1911/1915/1917 synthase
MSQANREFTYLAGEQDEIARLDAFLSRQSGHSRMFVQAQIQQGNVRVNDVSVTKASHKIRPGDRVHGSFDEIAAPHVLQPVAHDLEILFEDESLLALNKAQGVVVHPATGHRGDTLVHYLLHHLAQAPGFRGLSSQRPGIVHRLDRGTSGVLLVAKNAAVQENLSNQFKSRSIRKEYEAIIWGKPPREGRLSSVIGRDRINRKKMSSRTDKGRQALTLYRTAESFAHFSHLNLFPHTGRTHQLRVQLAEIYHPVVADALYGGAISAKRYSGLSPGVQRELGAAKETFLHARALQLQHPVTGEPLTITAPRPQNFVRLLVVLREEDR